MASMMASNTGSHLLRLPPELRNRVRKPLSIDGHGRSKRLLTVVPNIIRFTTRLYSKTDPTSRSESAQNHTGSGKYPACCK